MEKFESTIRLISENLDVVDFADLEMVFLILD
jgi:hypothetical protein